MNAQFEDQEDEVDVPDHSAAGRVVGWLHNNLGRDVVAMLTHGDVVALSAAVQVVELYQRVRQDRHSVKSMSVFLGEKEALQAAKDSEAVAQAFGACVRTMQPKCQQMAYHAIAMVGNWSERELWWKEAGLELPEKLWICNYEPGGARR